MILYNCPPSGNCYKVRLFAALSGLELSVRDVDLAAGEQHQPWFEALNPWQQVPVLHDGETVLWDSQAILIYLAERHQLWEWWPQEPGARARVAAWLSVSGNEIQHGPADARLVRVFNAPLDYPHAVASAARTLETLEKWLAEHPWLEGLRPTLAECAAYPYVALAPEGGIALDAYPAVRRWLAAVEALPGYVAVDA